MLGNKFGDTIMLDWENCYAESFIYQDLADCSLGTLPLVAELEKLSNENQNQPIEKILKLYK